MKSKKYIAPTAFTFLKWKRKGYAVFASLGKLIRIGKLSVSISQNLSSKNNIKSALFLSRNTDSSHEEKEQYEKASDIGELLLLLAGYQFATIFTFQFNFNQIEIIPFSGWIYHILFLTKVRFLLNAGNGLCNL